MSESRLGYLFGLYFNKTASAAERDELMELLSNPAHDQEVHALLTRAWDAYSRAAHTAADEKASELLSGILKKIAKEKPPVVLLRRSLYQWLGVAAAVLLLFSAGLFWLHSRRVDNTNPAIVQKTPRTILPGSNKAILTLSDGSIIRLDSSHAGLLAKQGNSRVLNLRSSTVSYHMVDEHGHAPVFNTLSTPVGGQYQLELADGTKVWLNASSSIRFPSSFDGAARNVSITGEVYFEVAKNKAMPFTVTAKDMTVQVLGTHFNIMSYDNEHAMNTTLLEGSVKVTRGKTSRMLAPGEESIVPSFGGIQVREADTEEVMAWKNGWFQFNAADIQKIMRQIARWYDAEIVYRAGIPGGHFSGMVSRTNNIEQVLKIMQAGGVQFKIEGRKISVF